MLNYFKDKNGIFAKFIEKICLLVDNLNKIVHQGEKTHYYSYEDFISFYNTYAKEKNLELITPHEKDEIKWYLDKLNITNFFN